VRRMVVVLRVNVPGNRASFEMPVSPESEFAGSVADRAGLPIDSRKT
jgi:hypothetical protein